MPGLFTSPTDGYGEPDDWKMAANADFFGTSIYPKHSQSTRPWPYPQLAAALDFSRSSGRSFGKDSGSASFRPGQGVTAMRIADPVSSARPRILDVAGRLPRRARNRGLCLVPDECRIRIERLRADQFRWNADRPRPRRRRRGPHVSRLMLPILMTRILRPHRWPSFTIGSLTWLAGKNRRSPSSATPSSIRYWVCTGRFFGQQIPVDFVHASMSLSGKARPIQNSFFPYAVMLSKDVAEGISATSRRRHRCG